jgi:hypothetical protein
MSSIRGIPYNLPRSIRIVCRRILKNERIIAVLEQAKNSLIDQAVASGYTRRRKDQKGETN